MIHTELSNPPTTEQPVILDTHSESPRLAWGSILGGTVAAIGIHILLTALGAGTGLATFSPVTDTNPVASLSIGSAIVWTICALVALGFGGLIAGRFSQSLRSGFVNGVLVWCSTLILTLLLVTVGTGMVMGGALKVFGASMGMGGQAVAGGVGELAKEAVSRSGDQLSSFIDEAIQSGPTNASPSAMTQASREIGFALTKLFTPGNEANSGENRTAAIQAITRYSGMSEPEATKAVDGWISSAKNLKTELDALKERAEAKARAAADVAAGHLSHAALWSFFGLLVGLLLTAMCGHYGAVCAMRYTDSKIGVTDHSQPVLIPGHSAHV
jgi:hypothetical protein